MFKQKLILEMIFYNLYVWYTNECLKNYIIEHFDSLINTHTVFM